MTNSPSLHAVIKQSQIEILASWLQEQLASPTWRPDLMTEPELRQQSEEFIALFAEALQTTDNPNASNEQWVRLREMLASISRLRAARGFSPVETATFIFSLKQSLFSKLRVALKEDAEALVTEIWRVTTVLDHLGLYTTEIYQKTREDVIRRQQAEMLELSTPVVKLWEGVLALPLIGTLDSQRTQIVMENLLQKIVETGSSIVIVDITGVPTVDTLVAQHLLKTVAAARLMGSDCIISGIRPQTAQTLVHLGVELRDVITRATLADAFVLALQRTGFSIVRPGKQS